MEEKRSQSGQNYGGKEESKLRRKRGVSRVNDFWLTLEKYGELGKKEQFYLL